VAGQMSMTHPSDLRQTVLDELRRVNASSPKGSKGAAERNYLLALGLIEKRGDDWFITSDGMYVLIQAEKEGL
jgi:hypothetical protein